GGGGLMAEENVAVQDETEFQPGEADGGMFGEVPAKKAKHFWPSAKRLISLLGPERALMSIVMVLAVASVVLTVIAPRILGKAMDVIFNGFLGSSLPAGVPKDVLVEQLRASGEARQADMLAATDVIPGEGIDFGRLGELILVVLAMYVVASFLMWANGFLLNRLVMRVVFRLREDIERKLNRLPL